jgi:hypothetical protein
MRPCNAFIIGIGFITMAGITACNDNTTSTDGPGAYVDEGSAGLPLDITGSLPYDGQVARSGTSNYRIMGVTPEAIYTITLTRTDGLPYQSVPNAAQTGSVACGWDNTTRQAVIDCAMRATAGGALDFFVRGDDTVGGTYVITFSGGGLVNEGSPGDPVVVSSFPFTGSALVQSYYLLTGLAPGGSYAIGFADASSAVALFIFPDNTVLHAMSSLTTRAGST